jgi:hypothetical protein
MNSALCQMVGIDLLVARFIVLSRKQAEEIR